MQTLDSTFGGRCVSKAKACWTARNLDAAQVSRLKLRLLPSNVQATSK